jgi:predicted acetyltransferase
MLRDYLQELSELVDGDWDSAAYPFLDEQWSEPGRHPFFIVHKAVRAGLLLVRDERSTLTEWRQIAEFYIAPDFRATGLAQAAAQAAFEFFPGHWELTVHQDNTRAVRFWQRCAATTSIGGVQLDAADGIVRLRFDAGLAGPNQA